jgi:hypothetical protein
MYVPQIVTARELERIKLGAYEARVLTDIVSKGAVKYLYIVEVLKDAVPCYYISSEENAMNADLGGGSHFLCAFEKERHLNFGCADKWADLKTFREKALEMTRQHLGVK